jgi:aryl-alcohol dehydrogenase-like predicted oxidoreductase
MCALFAPTTPPATKLGFLRQLAKRASARVSGFQLGAMSIGDVPALSANMGEMNKEKSFQLLDTFWDNGGN